MKNAKDSIENLEMALQGATIDAEIALKIFNIREKRLREKIQTLLETELDHFKEYKCKTVLHVNTENAGHTDTSIIIDVPIPVIEEYSSNIFLNVKIIFDNKNRHRILDIIAGVLMTKLKDTPEKYRASIIVNELAVAYNKQKLFIKKIEELMYNFKEYPTKVAEVNQQVKNFKKEISLVEKYIESTKWLKIAAQGNKNNIEEFLNSNNLTHLRKIIAPKFNAEGTKKEIIQEILEKLYI